jgi:GrpB-like predicted nucleotidyltransferase (UPF0157 family)
MGQEPKPEDGELVHFVPEAEVHAAVDRLWQSEHKKLMKLLPGADIQHVGATAVPGSLTKGDLDIQVRVTAADFADAEAVLAAHYQRNAKSDRAIGFASFTDEKAQPPLGVQLTAIDSPEDRFYRFRDVLRAHPPLREAYDTLKRGWEGRSIAGYRAEKAAFFAELGKIIASVNT